MKTLEEVLRKYTLGEAGKDETNDALEELGSSLRLNPGKNELTDEDIRATTVGHYPEQANGYGLLETGTGSLEKVHVTAGVLDYPINEGAAGRAPPTWPPTSSSAASGLRCSATSWALCGRCEP